MAIELKVPHIGESITEVEIGQWHKKEGDRVMQDEPLVDVESEKASVELPSPATGILSAILKQTGQIAQVDEVLCTIEEGEGETVTAAKPRTPAETPSSTKVMPSAKRIIAQEGLKSADIAPTGPGGRITKEDAEAAAASQKASAPPTPPFQRPEAASPENTDPSRYRAQARGTREERVVPMSMLRRTIASRLVEAKQNAALLTTFNEIDMSTVKQTRSDLQGEFVEQHGIKLGFMSFFVKATVAALKKFPLVNAEIRGRDIVQREYYDIGIAVGSGKGLVVPVLRNAETMSFAEIEMAIADLGRRATAGKLEASELEGGTFTISNGGVYGSMLSTPIVNPPQSGILGLHAIKDRAVVVEGNIVVRPIMYIALTYDHRIVDGREAVTFLKTVKERIENPARLLLEI